MLKKALESKGFRYLLCGGITALFNLLLIAGLVEGLQFDAALLRNIANAIAIEVSLLFSFEVYRRWVWHTTKSSLKQILTYQLPLYHCSAGAAIILRTLVIFPALEWLKVNYILNTLIGIILGAILNFFLSDRLAFRVK
jgi:dolichol-phosphate mannosyltransferase